MKKIPYTTITKIFNLRASQNFLNFRQGGSDPFPSLKKFGGY